jgi:hypothetical protein
LGEDKFSEKEIFMKRMRTFHTPASQYAIGSLAGSLCLLFLFTMNVGAQSETDLAIGQSLSGHLAGYQDSQVYRIPVTSGQKVFALLDKSSAHDTYLYLAEEASPERGTYSAREDQAVELVPQADGYCYIRIDDDEYEGSGINYTITAHDVSTFPTLTVGETLQNGHLSGDGDCAWFQVPVSAGQHVFALLNKASSHYTYLSISESWLPGEGEYRDASDQAVELVAQATTYAYVRVTDEDSYWDESGGSAFSLTIHDTASFPQLEIGETIENQQLSGDGDCAWFQVSVAAEQHIFALLDKVSSHHTYLSISESWLPEQSDHYSSSDQAVELTALESGYAYVRITDHYYNADAGTFSLTIHDTKTFPELAIGETIENQQLSGDGDCAWFQVSVAAGQHIFALLDKVSSHNTYLSVSESRLPEQSDHYSSSDQAVELTALEAGYAYVRITDNYNNTDGSAFSLTIHDTETFPKLEVGEKLSSQQLDGEGDCRWYQIPVTTEKVYVAVIKKKEWNTYSQSWVVDYDTFLSLGEGRLPERSESSSAEEHLANATPQSDQYLYVRLEDAEYAGEGIEFTIEASDKEIKVEILSCSVASSGSILHSNPYGGAMTGDMLLILLVASILFFLASDSRKSRLQSLGRSKL